MTQDPQVAADAGHGEQAGAGRAPSMAALALVTGVSPLATDTYLSALPQMQESLDTSAAAVQFTLTTFIVGFAIGQLVAGPLSDGLGRRRFILAGAIVFTVASALCATVGSAELLIGLRAVQGLAGGAAAAVGRAVVSDHWEGDDAATRFATLTSLFLLGPIIAPTLGSAVLLVTDWRGTFVLMTVLGVMMTVAAYRGLPETLPARSRQGGALGSQFRRITDLLTDRSFVGLLNISCLSSAAIFVYIGGSSFVFQSALGTGPGLYAIAFTVIAAVMTAASVVFRYTVTRWGAARLQRLGVSISATAATALAGLALLGQASLTVTWVLLAVILGGGGLAAPAHTIRVQEAGRRSAGSAAALNGGLVFAVGALTAPLVGVLGAPSVLTMAGAMAVVFVVEVATILVVNRHLRAAALHV